MIEILQQVPLFYKLNDEQLGHVADICTTRKFREGTVLFREKEPGTAFYIVVSGSVKLYLSQAGTDKILAIFKAGDSFGELSLIDGKPRSATAQTLEESVMLELAADKFLELLKWNFDITLCIMRELSQRLRNTNQHVYDLTFLDARSRVVKSLIMLANKHGTRQGPTIHVKLALNYDEISRMAGVQKNELLQVMRELENRGVITATFNEFSLHLNQLRGGG